MNRLRNRVEPFAALVLVSRQCTVLANTRHCTPAQHPSTAVHKACPCRVIIGSILSEDAPATPLSLSTVGCNLSVIYCTMYIDQKHEWRVGETEERVDYRGMGGGDSNAAAGWSSDGG